MEVGLVFIAGFPYSLSEDNLELLISPHGRVNSLKIITDKESGRSKGFAFVEMATREEAQQVVTALNGTLVEGRAIAVSIVAGGKEQPFAE